MQGVPLALFSGRTILATDSETHSFNVPILSSVIGCTANSFLNIGSTSKLQLVFQTSPILPFSINQVAQVANSIGATFTVTLSDFSLSLEYIDVGMQALQMIDQTLVNNKAYIHGVTYRAAAATLNATSGAVSILAGIRASSIKSLFTRFYENNSNGTINSANNKYDPSPPLVPRRSLRPSRLSSRHGPRQSTPPGNRQGCPLSCRRNSPPGSLLRPPRRSVLEVD